MLSTRIRMDSARRITSDGKGSGTSRLVEGGTVEGIISFTDRETDAAEFFQVSLVVNGEGLTEVMMWNEWTHQIFGVWCPLLSSNKSWSRTNLVHAATQMSTVYFLAVKTTWVGYLCLFQHDMGDINLNSAVKFDSAEAHDFDRFVICRIKSIFKCVAFTMSRLTGELRDVRDLLFWQLKPRWFV